MVWEKTFGGSTLFCDRDSSRGYHSYPSCYKGKAEYELTVDYNTASGEKDILMLCKSCVEGIKKDAQKHGYKVTVRKLKAKEMQKGIGED